MRLTVIQWKSTCLLSLTNNYYACVEKKHDSATPFFGTLWLLFINNYFILLIIITDTLM